MRCVPHNYRFKKNCIEFQNPAPWPSGVNSPPLGISSCSPHLRGRGIPVEPSLLSPTCLGPDSHSFHSQNPPGSCEPALHIGGA